jgi:two-component system, OmpR family, phosphate regulon sensor histidine kinase PhoR
MTETSVRDTPRWTSWWDTLSRSRAPANPLDRAPTPLERPLEAAALVEALPDPTILVDGEGVVATANARARALLPRLGNGAPLSFATRAPDLVDALAAVARDGATRTVTLIERVPIERTFEATVTRIARVDGPMRLVVVLHDLTERQKLERMRVDFVANASHELRTPLASLAGFIETLQGPAKDDAPARARFLEIMRQQAFRMSRLVDDLLSLSRIELAAHVRPETEVDLGGIVAETLDALSPLASDLGIAIERDFGEGPFRFRGERDDLVRVVENLVENALKYGADGQRIRVALARGGTPARPTLVLAVQDWGAGIEEAHIPRLTERFYRVDTAASREKGGTGLGLAIVKHIVARHRGRLEIESRPGAGATFRAVFEG